MLKIRVDQKAVNARQKAISDYSASFDVAITSVTGGNAIAVTEADMLGATIGSQSGRYATALSRSANDIAIIATMLQEIDRRASTQIGADK